MPERRAHQRPGVEPVEAVLFMPWSEAPARDFAAQLGCDALPVSCHRFPDGETRVCVPDRSSGRVVLFASLDDPDTRLVPLMLAAETARELGVRELILVAPYLCYMRQDIAFHPGEAVSQRIVGRWLARLFDAVITVDPHLHRVATLAEAVPARTAIALSAAPALGALAAERLRSAGRGGSAANAPSVPSVPSVPSAGGSAAPLLVGPDEESRQWVVAAAAVGGFDSAVCTKTRRGDRSVEVRLPDVAVKGRAVLLIDDVASTGRTLVEAAGALRAAGAASIDVAVTHALFVGNALAELRAAGVGHVWSTDAVAHATNAIALAPMLAAALR